MTITTLHSGIIVSDQDITSAFKTTGFSVPIAINKIGFPLISVECVWDDNASSPAGTGYIEASNFLFDADKYWVSIASNTFSTDTPYLAALRVPAPFVRFRWEYSSGTGLITVSITVEGE